MKVSADIAATVDRATKNYRSYPGVCAVSFGSKFSDGELVEGVEAVQFFVTDKIDVVQLSRSLPKHVFVRTEDGALDRSAKVPTDVIELKNMRLCCQGGDGVGNEFGAEGSLALIFENFADAGRRMALTCSHVASDLLSAGQSFEISGGADGCFFFATTTAFTTVDNDSLTFDIALAEIVQIDEFPPREVRGAGVTLTGFADMQTSVQGDQFECRSRRAGDHTITLQSASATFQNVDADDVGLITLDNLYACKGQVERGDSGGIVYLGDKAVGIIVAMADDGWVFIHALSDAIAFLEAQAGLAIEVF